MKISRRKFLGTAAVSTGLGLVFGEQLLAQQEIMPPIVEGGDFARLNFQSFFQYLNTDFLFRNKDGIRVPLRLVAVDDVRLLANRKWGQGKENFVLKFVGEREYPLKQDTYDVEHFALEKFRLFITEGGSDKSGIKFVAVINRVDQAS